MRDAYRHFTTEFVGTFALVFFGGAAIIQSGSTPGGGIVQVALAHGLILFALVTATMRVSGHFNPAVTIGFLVTRRIEPVMAGAYVVAQLLAAMLAAYALRGLLPDAAAMSARLGGQSIALDVSGTQAILLEAIATFMLTFVIFGTAVDPRAPRVGGLAIGMTVAAAIVAIGPYTGASLNPARSFGPAVASSDFTAQAVYWVGPILGSIAAALLYEHLVMHREPDPVDHGAVRPAP